MVMKEKPKKTFLGKNNYERGEPFSKSKPL